MFICSMLEHGDINFGVEDWNGPIPEDDNNIVDIREVNNPMLQEEEEELQSIISPTAQSDNFGVDIYIIVWEHVHDVIVNNNH